MSKKGTDKYRNRMLLLWAVFCLILAGCGGKEGAETKQEQSGGNRSSYWEGNLCFFEDGFLYHDPNSKVERYFDYKTREYFPLCAVPSCRHDTMDCAAFAINQKAMVVGRLGDKWYYLTMDDMERHTFHRCDLDGNNDREIGEFSHDLSLGAVCSFYDHFCIFTSWDAEFDWVGDQEEQVGMTSAIYRYDLDTGTEEVLCPEIRYEGSGGGAYEAYGIHEGGLIYTEKGEDQESILKRMDLETKESEELLRADFIRVDGLADGLAALGVRDGGVYKLMELHLGSKTLTEVAVVEDSGSISLLPGLKVYSLHNTVYMGEEENFHFETYQYGEKGDDKLIREGGCAGYFVPAVIKGDILIGHAGEGYVPAYMENEDFLAGKDNWTKIGE